VDGQIATVDFAAFDNGEPIEGVKAESFDLALGERQAWKTLKPWSRP
jgi:hypothetical protein